MTDQPSSRPADIVRPLIRTRQYREFTAEPPTDEELAAIADAGRWSGSSQNSQPWRFVVIRDPETLRAIANAGMTLTRSLQTATAAIAVVMPVNPDRATGLAYDDGRASERLLIAASMLGLGAGIAWLKGEAREVTRELLGIPAGWAIRTVVAIGHPTPAARAPKSAPGAGRLPREQVVLEERWPAG